MLFLVVLCSVAHGTNNADLTVDADLLKQSIVTERVGTDTYLRFAGNVKNAGVGDAGVDGSPQMFSFALLHRDNETEITGLEKFNSTFCLQNNTCGDDASFICANFTFPANCTVECAPRSECQWIKVTGQQFGNLTLRLTVDPGNLTNDNRTAGSAPSVVDVEFDFTTVPDATGASTGAVIGTILVMLCCFCSICLVVLGCCYGTVAAASQATSKKTASLMVPFRPSRDGKLRPEDVTW